MLKNIDKWIGSYLREVLQAKPKVEGPVHVMFCCVDHYEPDWNGADQGAQLARVRRWVEAYPALASKHQDADGQHPRHSFFYPAECYNKENLDLLESLCRQGFGEVEIHLHHDNDTEETLRAQLEKAKQDFLRHGFLSRRPVSGEVRYAFIHGNWALNNSRKDGRWCGVNNETFILKETGCYADFTFPSAPSETQPKKINSIYYAQSSTENPCGHVHGKDAQVEVFHPGMDLMLIQGPLTLNWKNRKKGILPRIENADLCATNPPRPNRVDLWVNQHIHVKGKPDWIFIKVHTHGAPEKNAAVLLGEPMDQMFSYLGRAYNDGNRYCLHYVSAREMYNIIKAAEAGESGNPGEYRNYHLLSNLQS